MNDEISQDGGFSVQTETDRVHRCSTYYQQLFDILIYPLKLLKTLLKNIPIPTIRNGRPTTVSIYQLVIDIANENRDYILLFKIFSLVVAAAITYYIYLKMFDSSLGLDLQRINMFLRTMNLSDLPMAENVDANLEAEALSCWQSYFSAFPYSFDNAGFYDMLRGAVLFPFLFVFFTFVLPIFLLIYVFWFIYHYFLLILDAIKGLVLAIFDYVINQVLCRIDLPIIGSITDCEDFTEAFRDWKREYIDEPVYRESLQYFKEYYKNKYEYIDKPVSYFEKLWRRGRVQSDYNNKFLTRAKHVFYEGILSGGNYVQQGQNKLQSFIPESNNQTINSSQTTTNSGYFQKINIQNIKQISQKSYSILKLLLPLLALIFLTLFFGFYAITGHPIDVSIWLGPLWRQITDGNKLKLLSSKYNWLVILAIPLLIIYIAKSVF